jgi:hypothetical protein
VETDWVFGNLIMNLEIDAAVDFKSTAQQGENPFKTAELTSFAGLFYVNVQHIARQSELNALLNCQPLTILQRY